LRNLLLIVGGAYASSIIYEKYKDGSLQEMTIALLDKLQSKVHEHVTEPFTKLGQELFNTIRNREIIVEREDLKKSREALERMLSDFSKSQQGHELIIPNIKEELLKKQRQLFQNGGGDGTSSASSSSTAADAVTDTSNSSSSVSTNPTAALEAISPTADQALAALMKEYERELQTPIRGIIFGSLFTAILIQVP
jgi:transcription-repair coupling factor (superfamily II helicase)